VLPATARAVTPTLVTQTNVPPHGFRLTAAQVERIAVAPPAVRAELRRHPTVVPYEYTRGPVAWQVSWFTPGHDQRELLQVYVDDRTGHVTEVWTGFQVAWTMARGYPGAFGRDVNSWWLWLPMCVAFLAPFLPLRRGARLSLFHLDLLVLLGFSVSLAFFNHARIGLSVPLVYPCLLYLLVRLLAIGFGRGRSRAPVRLLVPAPWLAVALVFLVGFRIGLNVTNSNVIDVGYAGVIGADKIIHGKPLYGGWPHDNAYGDTYGPVNYLAYVPFRAVFGWSGSWDDLPAARAAAIVFDLLTMFGLFLLGRRVRGPTLGITLAYMWAAFPFSLYVLESNSNDALVAALVVFALLVVGSPTARGGAAVLAGLTKFAPFALVPLLWRGVGAGRPSHRATLGYVLACAVVGVLAMLPVLLHHDLSLFWRHTVSYQAGRSAPFSVWGLWGGLSLPQHLVQGATVGLAIALGFIPRRRGIVEIAALGAAAIIALQLGVTYWFYLYIVWFFAPGALALAGAVDLVEPEARAAPPPVIEPRSLAAT
jgi:hypothetical protein